MATKNTLFRLSTIFVATILAAQSVLAGSAAWQVVREGGITMYMNAVVVLASVTCLTFIFMLLACGFEEPVI